MMRPRKLSKRLRVSLLPHSNSPSRSVAVLAVVGLLAVPGCGKGEAGLLGKSLMGQMSAMCPTAEFTQDGTFAARAEKFGLTSDSLPTKADEFIDAPVLASEWVAMDELGMRTTAWRGTFGPGEHETRLVLLVGDSGGAEGATFDKTAFTSSISCVAHAPDLTRADGWELAKTYGLESEKDSWRYHRDNGAIVTTGLRRVNGGDTTFWQEIEFTLPLEGETGVTIARRHFNKD